MIPDALNNGETRFDLRAAAFLAEMSRLAYASTDEVVQWFALSRKPGAYELLSVKNHQALAMRFEKFIVIAFRGTEKNYEDILTDLDTDKVRLMRGSDCEVHDGFNKGADALTPLVYRFLMEHCQPGDKPVYYTGHSLGGALAQLVEWKAAYPRAVIYSFGAPRVGNGVYADLFEDETPHFRIVNASDIVPNLPPMSMGFKHWGQHYYIAANGDMLIEPGFWQQLLDQWRDVIGGISSGIAGRIPVRRFTRHRVAEYYDRLSALVSRHGG